MSKLYQIGTEIWSCFFSCVVWWFVCVFFCLSVSFNWIVLTTEDNCWSGSHYTKEWAVNWCSCIDCWHFVEIKLLSFEELKVNVNWKQNIWMIFWRTMISFELDLTWKYVFLFLLSSLDIPLLTLRLALSLFIGDEFAINSIWFRPLLSILFGIFSWWFSVGKILSYFSWFIENNPYRSIYRFRKNIFFQLVFRKMIKTELALRTHSTKLKCPSETLSNMISLDIKRSYDTRLCHKSM